MVNAKKNKEVADSKSAGSAATNAAGAKQEAKRTPVRTIREGDCSASIWVRDVALRGETLSYFSVTIERSYKDRDGQFRYTKSFDPESLPKVAILCQSAQDAIDALQRA